MKTLNFMMLAAVSALTLTSAAIAQEGKKYKIYMNLNKNGKEVIIDTTFATRVEMEAYMESNGFAQPEFPELPELPELPNLETINIEIEDAQLSAEEKAQMEKEMKIANEEMRIANKEMRKAQMEMKISNEEMKKIEKDLKQMKIEIEHEGGSGDKIIIRNLNDDSKNSEDQKKLMFINVEDEGNASSEIRVIRMNCDSLSKDGKQVTILRKMPANKEADEAPKKVYIRENRVPENTDAELNKIVAKGPASYELKVTDFKLFPNPTAGKINISFRTDSTGTIEIKLLDGSGKVILEDQVENHDGFFNKEYNMEGKSRGTYLLQINSGNKWRHEKVVLK
jgi:hypothetical protein